MEVTKDANHKFTMSAMVNHGFTNLFFAGYGNGVVMWVFDHRDPSYHVNSIDTMVNRR
jgi:hypothetical protein